MKYIQIEVIMEQHLVALGYGRDYKRINHFYSGL